jgi:tight adherence protein B
MSILARVRTRRLNAEPEASAASEAVLRIAVLLQAGIAPARTWDHLADTGDATALAVRARVGGGMPLPQAIAAAGGSWREVSAAWTIATTVGAPLADSLRALAAALRDGQESADEVRVALAEPAGTARLMGWLPLVGVGLGAALGFDTLAVLFTNPLGIACLVAGAALILLARRWTGRLVRGARPAEGVPGLEAELVAIGLSGGASIERARRIVTDASGREPGAEVSATLELSCSAGVPAVELLRASAALSRHRARTAGRLRAAALSSRLLLPLGVCTLPAFLLLGVAPMLLSVIASTSLTL